MEILEIYRAPQGEGLNIGIPSIFVRLQFCPFACSWCDIKPSWAPKSAESKTMTVSEVISHIDILADMDISHVVITGGEPMAQRKEVESLVLGLHRGYHVEIETTGSYKPLIGCNPQYNVSPKMPSAQSKSIPSATLSEYVDQDAIFKFVIDDQLDFETAKQTCDLYSIPYNRVFLMPQGTTRDEIIPRMGFLENAILSLWPQVRLTTRLHILMHDNERKR